MGVVQLLSTSLQSPDMSSTKTWVIFEEEENTVTQRTNTTTTTQPWMIGNHEIQSAGLDQLKIISTSFGCSKYSVFDSLRRKEEKGGYLGWSKELLGEPP